MNIWGRKPSASSTTEEFTNEKSNSPIEHRSNPPRIGLPKFKTVEEYQHELRKENHQDPDNVRPEREPTPKTITNEPRTTVRSKRRGYSISICVSEEEESILRKAASDEGMTFSGWARINLFKAANKKIPKRHK